MHSARTIGTRGPGWLVHGMCVDSAQWQVPQNTWYFSGTKGSLLGGARPAPHEYL